MNCGLCRFVFVLCAAAFSAAAAPVIDPIGNASIPAGKSLIVPVTASSPNGRPLTFTATSSTNRITVEVQTNNPFWKMSIVQAAPSNAPGAFPTPFRGGTVIVTNVGDLTFMLFKSIAPRTVDVMQGLTASGFYTSNTIFHRVVPGFVIQGGDPQTNGMGGPVFRYEDEFHPRALFDGHGQLAMANSGKDTDGSQFFVTMGPQRSLDFGYTLFGQLVRGFNVLTNIGNTPTNGASRPVADVIITKASFVPNPTDTVLFLAGTNLAGVAGTITVIADDGAGGRATNTFTAATVADPINDLPFIYPNTVTNRVGPMNARLTNVVSTVDLETNAVFWQILYLDQSSSTNTSPSSTFTNINGQMHMVIVARTNYVGRLGLVFRASPNQFFFNFDQQIYTFAFGDTAISAQGTNFVAPALVPFTNEVLATFTNGVPNSTAANFTAFINWGDNSTNSGVITTNLAGRKEVRGSHTYTNSGHYPVYITIQSTAGTDATVVSTAIVPPNLELARAGVNTIVRWPAWATDYQLQSHTNLTTANWAAVTNLSSLSGYESVVTNGSTGGSLFFRLRK